MVAGRPAQPVHQDPGHQGGPAGDRRSARRGHQRQRHADLLAGALRRGDGRLPGRHGAGPGRRARPATARARSRRSSSAGSTPRSTSGWTSSAREEAKALRGKAAIANARLAYQHYEEVFGTDRWKALAAPGAKPQRPLWASTGVKDPAYDDTHVRRRPGRAGRRQHDAGGDAGRGRRPRRGPRRHDPRRCTRTAQRRWTALAASASTTTTSCRCSRTRASRSSRRPGHELLDSTQGRARRGSAAGQGATRPGSSADGVVARRRRRLADRGADGLRRRRGGAGRQGPDPVGAGRGAEAADPARLARPARDVRRRWSPGCAALREELTAEGLDHVVLAGMGGSSLAPEVIMPHRGRRADRPGHHRPAPGRGRAARPARPDRRRRRSKSGGTVETDSHRRAYAHAFRGRRRSTRVAERIVVVTDPGSPLEKTAAATAGYAVVLADPNVGGRYSALTAFGLVPERARRAPTSSALLADAAGARRRCSATTDNPGLELGARARRRRRRRPRQGRDRRRRLGHRRLRRLGRAAGRRVHRQAGHRHPAGRRRGHRRARASPTPARTPTGSCSAPGRPGLDGRRRSPARSARSSCSGSTPPRSPAGSSASTRSTSPTCTSPRTTPAKILEESGDGPLPEGEPAWSTARSRCTATSTSLGGAGDLAGVLPRRWSARSPTAATWRSWPTSTGTATRRRGRPAPRLARRRAGGRDLRLGAAVPALDRAVPQGRPAGRRRSCRSPAPSNATCRCPGRPYTFGRLQMAQALGDLRRLGQRGTARSCACT